MSKKKTQATPQTLTQAPGGLRQLRSEVLEFWSHNLDLVVMRDERGRRWLALPAAQAGKLGVLAAQEHVLESCPTMTAYANIYKDAPQDAAAEASARRASRTLLGRFLRQLEKRCDMHPGNLLALRRELQRLVG
ncbi:MAG: hypothetical protein RL095_2164 [Verrucomicrobiota bacterium]|jgi:hypothetical protein